MARKFNSFEYHYRRSNLQVRQFKHNYQVNHSMIEIWSKPQCIFCSKAVRLCELKKLDYRKHMLDVDFTLEDLRNRFPEARTFPQITMDGAYIGGYAELEKHLS